jgi:hypothetical protein
MPFARRFRPPWMLLLCLLAPTLACSTETRITDDFSTEVTLVSPGRIGEDFSVRKRFRFSVTPADARRLTFRGGLLIALDPPGTDLTFLHRLTVLVEDADGVQTELAEATDFEEGQRYVQMDVLFDDDLRELVTPDGRVTLVFRIEPSAWYGAFPRAGITVLARASLEILL